MNYQIKSHLVEAAKKRCTDCGIEKPLTKFYRFHTMTDGLMPWCKACHNGVTESNQRRSEEVKERQLGDPSEATIAAMCAAIQSKWTARKREARKNRKVPA